MTQPDAIRGVVFDLDDTLYPELDFVRSGFRAIAAAFSSRLGPPQAAFDRLWHEFQTGDRRHVFDRVVSHGTDAADPTLVSRMVDTYRRHMPSLTLFPDADRALERLAGRMRLGILSDGAVETQRNKIAVLALQSRVNEVIISDEIGREYWKPHVRCFEEIAKRLGCSAAELAYVADNPAKDFVAPNALGWLSIRVRREGGIYGNVPDAAGGAPQRVIDTLDDLPW